MGARSNWFSGVLGPPPLRPDEMFPAGVKDLAARFVSTASGLRIRIAEAGPASGRPVLLLHGWGCSLYTYRHLLRPLAEMGYRATAVDMQGHGLSDKPTEPHHYTLPAMTTHALQVADALELDEFEVFGHSMGGRVALEMALVSSARIKRLWLLNPVGFGPMPHVTMAVPLVREALARRMPAPLPVAVVRAMVASVYGRVGTYTGRDVDEYRAPTQFRDFLNASALLLRRFDWRVVDAQRAAPLRARTSVVTGDLDRVVQIVSSHADQEWLRQGWNVRVLPGVAHVVHEETPAEVMQVVRAGQ